MKKAVINFKTDLATKKAAQRKAASWGMSLSSLLNYYLINISRAKSAAISFDGEEPSEYLIEQLKQSEADRKAGRYHSFDNTKDAVKFLRGLRNKNED